MSRVLLPWLCAFLLLFAACDPPGEPAPALAPPPASATGEPGAATGAAAAPPEAVTPPRERLLGSWTLELTPAQQRQYTLLELAFRDPAPTAAELAALNLDQGEQMMLNAALAGRAQNPGDMALPEIRRGLTELATATLEVTEGTLVFSFGEEREEATYTIASEQDGRLSLLTVTEHEGGAVSESVTVTFEGEDRLILDSGSGAEGSRQVFARRKAAEEGAAPAQAAPSAAPVPAAAPAPAAPPAP